MNYKSIKHSFLIILIATTIVGCAANSVQVPASQYQTSSESFDSQGDTSSIDVEDVDKEEMAKQESENSLANLGKKVGDIIKTTAAVIVLLPFVALMALSGGGCC